MILQHKNERKRLYKFLFVGTLGMTVDFTVFNLLTQLVHLPPVPASILSFITAATHNFTWHRFWTYPESRSKHVLHQWVQFIIVAVIGLLLRTALFALIRPRIVALAASCGRSLPLKPVVLGNNVSLAIVILVVTAWNFTANRFWTYNDVAIGA